ncbi:hypothetical protein D6833_11310 [Candidatus Parcubacteria bacterium]|nr:MAG: hypothetical protein D6833_11310 [Candidatus Parcubacteria bacterium]
MNLIPIRIEVPRSAEWGQMPGDVAQGFALRGQAEGLSYDTDFAPGLFLNRFLQTSIVAAQRRRLPRAKRGGSPGLTPGQAISCELPPGSEWPRPEGPRPGRNLLVGKE